MAHQLTKGLYAIDGYEGQLRERGILRQDPDGEVVKTIAYGRLWRVRAEVVAPEEHAGELFVFDGSTVTMWWPRFFFGLRVGGIEVPTKKDVHGAIVQNSFWALKTYDYENEGELWQAGRKVDRWSGTPHRAKPLCYPYRAWIDQTYRVPLKVQLKRGSQEWYGMSFDSIAFGEAPPDEAFVFDPPEGAVIHEWNLADPGVTLEEAQARVEFPILVPTQLPRGHAVNKIVMSRNDDMHMVALLMQKRGSWLSLSEIPNMGPILVPKLGIPVAIGEREGILNFAGGFSVVSWAIDNTALTLIGNLPYPEMVAVAASVGPSRGEEN
jgi:outer membrane lipoprotein-sorting protein